MSVRALILEDDVQSLRLYMKILRKMNVDPYGATTLQEARDLLTHNRFDIFLCDMMLDGEEGVDLLREQKERLRSDQTSVVVVSAESRYQILCARLGFDVFVSKPLPPSVLTNIIMNVLRGEV